MNREGSSVGLARALAPARRPWAVSLFSTAPLRPAVRRIQRERLLMSILWMFIGLVAAYDTYLSIKYQEVLRFQELNPMGQWLMDYDGGSVAAFMGCKFVGTLLVLGIIQLLYLHKRAMGLAVATALAGLQGMLAMYLTFG
jgi:hypothetical protein